MNKQRKLTRKRKVLFTAVSLLLIWLVSEGLVFCGLKLVNKSFSFEGFHQARQYIISGDVSDAANECIHPYMGWVLNPDILRDSSLDGRDVGTSQYGFADDLEPIVKRSDDKFIVAILGGSVGWQVSVAGEELIKEQLEASPLLNGRKVRLVRLALSGFKQPQQVMTLNYMLAQGGEFDAIINIDGYNEAALTVSDNIRAGQAAAFPRGWYARTLTVVDPRDSADSFALHSNRAQRQSMAKSLVGSVLRYSPIANAIWKIRDDRCRSNMIELGIKLSQSRRPREELSYASYGPPETYENDEAKNRAAVDLWMRCSRLLHDVSKGHGAHYIHVLQPNQYHEGSKPMSKQELIDTVSATQKAGLAAKAIYPMFVEAGPELIEQGIYFSDQSMLFSDVEEVIYCDGWCHYNTRGNQMLAKAAVTELLKAMDQAKTDPAE